MQMKDIDKHLSASGVVKLIELKQKESENRLRGMLNVAGVAKPGKAMGVKATVHSISAAKTVLRWIEDYLKSVEE